MASLCTAKKLSKLFKFSYTYSLMGSLRRKFWRLHMNFWMHKNIFKVIPY